MTKPAFYEILEERSVYSDVKRYLESCEMDFAVNLYDETYGEGADNGDTEYMATANELDFFMSLLDKLSEKGSLKEAFQALGSHTFSSSLKKIAPELCSKDYKELPLAVAQTEKV